MQGWKEDELWEAVSKKNLDLVKAALRKVMPHSLQVIKLNLIVKIFGCREQMRTVLLQMAGCAMSTQDLEGNQYFIMLHGWDHCQSSRSWLRKEGLISSSGMPFYTANARFLLNSP